MDIMELLQNILEVLLYAVITGAGVVVVKNVLDFVNSKIDEVQATTKLAEYEKLNKIIDQAQGILYNIVVSVNQTFVDSLKTSGEFTKESAEIAKDTAVNKATELLTEEAVKAIETVYGSLDTYLDVTIEALVRQLKQNK